MSASPLKGIRIIAVEHFVAGPYGSMLLADWGAEVIRIERTYRFLKSECVSSEDIEEILVYSNDYYSDRSIDKWVWNDEPVKEFATKYPIKATGVRGGKRCRAREDPWAEMSFYILV